MTNHFRQIAEADLVLNSVANGPVLSRKLAGRAVPLG
jgi:hypothetical protein